MCDSCRSFLSEGFCAYWTKRCYYLTLLPLQISLMWIQFWHDADMRNSANRKPPRSDSFYPERIWEQGLWFGHMTTAWEEGATWLEIGRLIVPLLLGYRCQGKDTHYIYTSTQTHMQIQNVEAAILVFLRNKCKYTQILLLFRCVWIEPLPPSTCIHAHLVEKAQRPTAVSECPLTSPENCDVSHLSPGYLCFGMNQQQ